MRSTEIGKGTHKGDVDLNGQWRYKNLYCPTCHASNCGEFGSTTVTHKKGCTDKEVSISPTARLPRANASKQQWKYFNKKFVINSLEKRIKRLGEKLSVGVSLI